MDIKRALNRCGFTIGTSDKSIYKILSKFDTDESGGLDFG
jgi:hypothetical protein